jgi:hypothetical protein
MRATSLLNRASTPSLRPSRERRAQLFHVALTGAATTDCFHHLPGSRPVHEACHV